MDLVLDAIHELSVTSIATLGELARLHDGGLADTEQGQNAFARLHVCFLAFQNKKTPVLSPHSPQPHFCTRPSWT